jgi:hypothetical protein
MEADGSGRLRPGRKTALRILALAAAIALVVVGAVVLFGGDDDEESTVKGPPGHEFTLLRPEGWTEVGAEERDLIPGKPLAVLRREQGEGLVTVNAPARREQDVDAIAAELDRQLAKAIPDFRKVAARVVRVEAGRALLYSYVRTTKGTAHTLLVVPGPEVTYTVNAVVPAGAEDAARDVGRILNSFDV